MCANNEGSGICAVLPEPSLVAHVLRTLISWAGTIKLWYPSSFVIIKQPYQNFLTKKFEQAHEKRVLSDKQKAKAKASLHIHAVLPESSMLRYRTLSLTPVGHACLKALEQHDARVPFLMRWLILPQKHTRTCKLIFWVRKVTLEVEYSKVDIIQTIHTYIYWTD